MIKAKVTVEPATEPVTLTEIKAHLIIDHNDDDTLLTLLGKGARLWVERYLGRKLITTTIEETYDTIDRTFYLAYAPLIAVTKLEYYINQAYTTWTPAKIADSYHTPPRVMIHPDEVIPTTDRVINKLRVTYTAGYGDAADVPELIKQAILMRVAASYEIRSDYAKQYLDASTSLIRSYKNNM